MIDLEQLQVISQLIENLNIIAEKLERSYNENDIESFQNHKKNILEIQDKINSMMQ